MHPSQVSVVYLNPVISGYRRGILTETNKEGESRLNCNVPDHGFVRSQSYLLDFDVFLNKSE